MSSTICSKSPNSAANFVRSWSWCWNKKSSIWDLGATRSSSYDLALIDSPHQFYQECLVVFIPMKFGSEFMSIFTNRRRPQHINFELSFVRRLLEWNWYTSSYLSFARLLIPQPPLEVSSCFKNTSTRSLKVYPRIITQS